MITSREQILNNIRENLGERVSDKKDINAAYKQLKQHIFQPQSVDLIDAFQQQLESLAGQVTRVNNLQDVVDTVLNILKKHANQQLLISDSELCMGLEWPDNVQTECRRAKDSDKVSLSSAYAGIAETGSIVMCSSPQTPTTHNFLVDDHIVLLPVSRIFNYLETLWEEFDKNNMPRAFNVLTGPSRTADVEQTIQIGAHGPLRFHVIILVNE